MIYETHTHTHKIPDVHDVSQIASFKGHFNILILLWLPASPFVFALPLPAFGDTTLPCSLQPLLISLLCPPLLHLWPLLFFPTFSDSPWTFPFTPLMSISRNKARMLTLDTFIQHSFASPGHSNQRRKRNKRNPDWKRRKTVPICRWHDTILYTEKS